VRLIDLHIDNFKTYGEGQVIDFTRYDDNDPILIIGENRDEGGMDSNGAGKTTLLDALSWAIFGRVPDVDSVDDVVHYGTKACKVILRLEDEGREIVITRSRKASGKSSLSWFIDGEDESSRTDTQTQNAILNYFGIMENNKSFYDDFRNTTYFSLDSVKGFAGKSASSSDRIGLITRFLNLAVLDKALSRARVLFNNLNASVSQLEGRIQFLEEKLEKSKSKEEATSKLSETRAKIGELKADLNAIKRKAEQLEALGDVQRQIDSITESVAMAHSQQAAIIETYEDQIQQLKKDESEIKNIEAEIDSIVLFLQETDAILLQEQLDKLDEFLQQGSRAIDKWTSRLDIISGQVGKAQSCPQCDAPLMVGADGKIDHFDLETLKAEAAELEEKLKKARKKWQKYDSQRDQLQTQMREYNDRSQKLTGLNQQLARIQKAPEKITRLEAQREEKLAESKEFIKKNEKQKLTLELRIKKAGGFDPEELSNLDLDFHNLEEAVSGLTEEAGRLEIMIEQVDRDKKDLRKAKRQLKEVLEEQAGYGFWKQGFPEIRRWMIDSFLPAFEEQTNHFLHKMDVSFRVRFDTQTETKKGKVKDQFGIVIIDREGNKRPLEGYSGGESKRIGICVGFALRELTLDKGYSNFNFLLLDEVVDSLDETGIGEFFGLLHSITGMKFVITHEQGLKTRFHKVIKVTKEDGFSSIEQL